MGSPLRLRPSASRPRTLPSFPKSLAAPPDGDSTARSPKKPNDSPRDLHLSHRVGRSPVPSPLAVSEETAPDSGSSHEVCIPFSVLSRERPLSSPQSPWRLFCTRRSDCPTHTEVCVVWSPGRCLPGSFRPRRFSRPRRFAPPSTVPRFPRVPLMGFCPSGSLPSLGGPAHHWTRRPLLPFRAAPLAVGLGPTARSLHRRLQGLSPRADRRRSRPVSR